MIGKTLAHYQITAPLGKGGMGEVYRARDTKLDRDVALKLLPENFASDPERLARMRREAKLLASLNHPNIAAIHGVEDADGHNFLVMELAEGEELTDLIGRGPLPTEDALEIAHEIAEGLEEAHKKGIVHRDLKPANVMISPEHKVKILDFGLARAFAGDEGDEIDSTLSPTITALHTQAGAILGTAAYMSPEQARGLAVDKRSDVWAFGVILFEMLTGNQLFQGDTVTDKLASILKNEPDWDELPPDTPPRIRELLERCLAKRRHDRLQDIGDARLDIDWTRQGRGISSGGPGVAAGGPGVGGAGSGETRRGLPVLPTIVGSLALVALVAVLVWNLHPGRDGSSSGAQGATESQHLTLSFPPELEVGYHLTAADGKLLVSARPRQADDPTENVVRLYLREPSSYEFRPIDGSRGVRGFCFSSDSRWIAMVAPDPSASTGNHLWKVPADGSAPPLRILKWPDEWTFVFHWMRDGDLMASTHSGELVRIPADGGAPAEPVKILSDQYTDEFGAQPSHAVELPDGVHLLGRIEQWSDEGYAQDIAVSNVNTGESRIIIRNGDNPRWLDTGHILFSRGTVALAQRFDLDTLSTVGGPVAVADGLRTTNSWSHGDFTVSANGDLYYPPGGLTGQQQQLVWTDRNLREFNPWSEERRAFDSIPVISPDERHVAIVIASPTGVYETWLSRLDRPGWRRFIFEKGRDCSDLLWTPDGKQLTYCSFAPGGAQHMSVPVDGGAEPRLLFERVTEARYTPDSFADDGRLMLLTRRDEGRFQIMIHPFDEDAGTAPPTRVLLENASAARISPDGRWLAYESNPGGRLEIYLRRWLGDGELGPEMRVSTNGGSTPQWFRDGDAAPLEIWYEHERKIFAVTLTTDPEPSLGRPQVVVELTPRMKGADFTRDGRLLLRMGGEDELAPDRLNVILNWKDEIAGLLESSK